MKHIVVLIAVVCLSFVWLSNISFAYAGHSGTAEDPIQISTSADINQLMNSSGDWGSYFILTDDIDCSSASWSFGNPQPIGNETTAFTGNFDGQGYTISNIIYDHLTGDSYFGFFGNIGEGGNVSRLILKNMIVNQPTSVMLIRI